MPIDRWLLCILLAATPAFAADYSIGIGDDCGLYQSCFLPNPLTVDVGDTVTFYSYAELFDTGPHNVVADDGSFRCARGCEDAGGSAFPSEPMYFTRTFATPGIVRYHDDVSRAAGVITVLPAIAIGPGFTGTWYDPAQSGHGLIVEVLSDHRFLAWWFTFNPAGTAQAWFGGVGTYSGNTATITQVAQTTGGRFIPNFDPSLIVNNPWGTLNFVFTDCDHGTVAYESIRGSDYGFGSMQLTRLSNPLGSTCSTAAAAKAP